MDKIQQIFEQEDETLWQQIKCVADLKSALAQQRQLSEGNQDSILNVIRTELEEMIETKSQTDISALVRELFTLRCDTNYLLEAQSVLRCTTQEEATKTENISVEDANETAEVKHHLLRKISCQVYAKVGSEPRNNRSNGMKKSLKVIQNCRHGDSAKSDSDDSGDKFVTDDSQIIHSARQHEI